MKFKQERSDCALKSALYKEISLRMQGNQLEWCDQAHKSALAREKSH